MWPRDTDTLSRTFYRDLWRRVDSKGTTVMRHVQTTLLNRDRQTYWDTPLLLSFEYGPERTWDDKWIRKRLKVHIIKKTLFDVNTNVIECTRDIQESRLVTWILLEPLKVMSPEVSSCEYVTHPQSSRTQMGRETVLMLRHPIRRWVKRSKVKEIDILFRFDILKIQVRV